MRLTAPSSAEVKNEWSYTAALFVYRMALQCTETRISVETGYSIEMRSILLVFTRVICPGSVYTCNMPSKCLHV